MSVFLSSYSHRSAQPTQKPRKRTKQQQQYQIIINKYS